MSVFPKPPSDVNFGVCTVDGVEHLCFLPAEITKIAVWREQVERWHKEVQTCKYVREFTHEALMYKIMESF